MFTVSLKEWLHAAAQTAGVLSGTSSWYDLALAETEAKPEKAKRKELNHHFELPHAAD